MTIRALHQTVSLSIDLTGDPYVVAILNGQKIHKTAVKHSTQQPSFNETKQVGIVLVRAWLLYIYKFQLDNRI